MIVLTRWATITTAASPRLGLEAPRAAARRSRRRAQRSSRRRGRPAVVLTSALAIESRWRCPPETFVPPWSMGASRPPGMVGDEVACLGDLERVPELSIGRLGIAEPQVARDGATEQVRRLGNEAERAPQLLRAPGHGRPRRSRARARAWRRKSAGSGSAASSYRSRSRR